MLYVSTRNKTDSYTAYRALHENRAPDGGIFVPFHLPRMSEEELIALKNQSFSETVAQILNRFFSCQFNGWDVEFCIGRYPYKLETMGQRIVVAELWHNTEATYAHMVQSLYNKLCTKKDASAVPPLWVSMAIEIAILFGVFGELFRKGIERADIAVSAGDFHYPMAAWYARRMGLPINCIICGCNENGGVWDLLHRGEFVTNASTVRTDLPVLDVSRPEGLECLIHGTLGSQEVGRYLEVCARRGSYHLTEEALGCLNQGMFAAVIGADRVDSVISSVYRTNAYMTDPLTAVSYGALQDYRARTGENRYTLLLARCSPLFSARRISSAIGCSQEKLEAMIHISKE